MALPQTKQTALIHTNNINFDTAIACLLIFEWKWLKTLDPIGNCQRPVFLPGVSQHMHKITNLWTFELNRSSKLRDNNERKKINLVTRSCVLSDAWFRDLKILNLMSRNKIREKITCFSKTTLLQREPFLTMFYTIKLSPLLITKYVFMLIIILSYYQKCPLPLRKAFKTLSSEDVITVELLSAIPFGSGLIELKERSR